MDKDFIKKRIDYLRDERNHLWTALIVTIGGTLTLLFNMDNILKAIFFILGLIFSVIFLLGYFKKVDQIELLFDKLEKE
jgi:intracellular septation protein A